MLVLRVARCDECGEDAAVAARANRCFIVGSCVHKNNGCCPGWPVADAVVCYYLLRRTQHALRCLVVLEARLRGRPEMFIFHPNMAVPMV